MMGSTAYPDSGKHELASREPSAFALAIIAALTLAVSTDHLGTAYTQPTMFDAGDIAATKPDTSPDKATA